MCVYFAARALLTGLTGGGFAISSLVQWGVWALALELAGRVEQQAPLPLAMTKALLAEGLDLLLEREGELQSQLFLSADHAEGKAAFLAKRPPVFRGN